MFLSQSTHPVIFFPSLHQFRARHDQRACLLMTPTLVRPTKRSINEIKGPDEIYKLMLCVFIDAQANVLSHRKLLAVLQHLWNKLKELDEVDQFTRFFNKMINRILPVKKGEKSADRLVKFVAQVVSDITKTEENKGEKKKEKDIENEDDDDGDEDEDDDDDDEKDEEDDDASFFVKTVIEHLLRGIHARDKTVRYRVTQMLALTVRFLTELDSDMYESLVETLTDRLTDRETSVRIQAVDALLQFQGYGSHAGEISKLLLAMLNDSAAEVRRAVVLNLQQDSNTVPEILSRSRDVSTINRRLIYTRTAREVGVRNMEADQIQELLTNGLSDRDSLVKEAAVQLVTEHWLEELGGDVFDLLAALRPAINDVAERALLEFFRVRRDFSPVEAMKDDFLSRLGVETAFFFRVYFDYCNGHKMIGVIEESFPEAIDLLKTVTLYFDLRRNSLQGNMATNQALLEFNNELRDIDDEIFCQQNIAVRSGAEMDLLGRKLRDIPNFELSKRKLKAYKHRMAYLKKKEAGVDEVDGEGAKLARGQRARGRQDEEELLPEDQEFDAFYDHIEGLSLEELELNYKQFRVETRQIQKRSRALKQRGREEETRNEEARLKLEELNVRKKDHMNKKLGEVAEFEDDLMSLEFTIKQLLLVARDYDFSDDFARREMMLLMRRTLSSENLPDDLIKVAFQVVRKLSLGEKDFVQLATEIITDIRDAFDNNDEEGGDDEEEEEVFHSAHLMAPDPSVDADDSMETPVKKRKVGPKMPPDDVVTLCLRMTQHVLELVVEPLTSNPQLESLYYGIVQYALLQSTKYELHKTGLKCLGLYGLLSDSIATDAIYRYLQAQRQYGQEIMFIAIQAMVDILATHGMKVLPNRNMFVVARMFHKSLVSFDYPKIQCVVAEGLCKLFLGDLFAAKGDEASPEVELFESLLLCFFDPRVKYNAELKQVLAFCIPVYAFSHPHHQLQVASVLGECLFRLFSGSDSDQMLVTPAQVVQQLIYWCDPNNLVMTKDENGRLLMAHVYQATFLLQVVEQDSPRAVKRAILANLVRMLISLDLLPNEIEALLLEIKTTRDVLNERSHDDLYSLDKVTSRNFDLFETMVEDALVELVEKNATSRALSLAPLFPTTPEGRNLEDVDDNVEDDKVDEIVEEEPQENAEKVAINKSLAEIDQELAEADEVDYDIDVSMDLASLELEELEAE